MSVRVLQVLHQGGGAGSVTSTLHLAHGLQAAGAVVRFACPPDTEVEAQARARGLEVHPLALQSRGIDANALALRDLLDAHPVDVVNSQSARDRRALTWLAYRGRLPEPLVLTRRQMPRTVWLENWLASRAAARVVAVSRAVAEALRKKGTPRAKLVVIPNGLVIERVDAPVARAQLDAWRARIGWIPGQRTLAIVARPKDQAVVLAALAGVRTPVCLVLAGVPPDHALGELARRVSPPHAAICLPFTAEVRPLYELVDLALLPSRSEGLSQALLEAMALGVPVIASGAGGNLELVTPGQDGLVVPPLDTTAWAAAIERLLGDRELAARLGAAARHTARERFSLEHTVRRTLALYAEVAAPTLARARSKR